MRKKEPVVISVNEKEFEQLKKDLENNTLGEKEKKIMLAILETHHWLSQLYRAKRLSLERVKRLFGFKSEKEKKKKDNDDKGDGGPPGAPREKKKEKNGHGRKGKDNFPGAKKQFHPLEGLKKGDPCPKCPLGRLYPVTPGTHIHFIGQTPLEATIHETEKLRCNGCGEYFEAELDEELKQKYHPSSDVAIALQKYSLGLPFYRMGRWQHYLGVPLSASTQWERCEHLVNSVYPVYQKMLEYASNGDLFHGDDTSNRILDEEKYQKKKGGRKRAVWTTGVLSRTKWGWISLFFTKTQHCGQNMT